MDNQMNQGYGTYNPEYGTDQADPGTELGLIDILNMPVPIALLALAEKGVSTVRDIKQTTRETFQRIADEEYLKMCRPVLTFDDCVRWIRLQKQSFPQIAYMFIYAEKNVSPRNEYDVWSIAVAGIDALKHAIPISSAVTSKLFPSSTGKLRKNTKKDTDIVCVVIPAKTLDDKLICALKGGPSVLLKL